MKRQLLFLITVDWITSAEPMEPTEYMVIAADMYEALERFRNRYPRIRPSSCKAVFQNVKVVA